MTTNWAESNAPVKMWCKEGYRSDFTSKKTSLSVMASASLEKSGSLDVLER